MRRTTVPWNKKRTPYERATEEVRVDEAIAQCRRESEQIRLDALHDVLADIEVLARKWSENR